MTTEHFDPVHFADADIRGRALRAIAANRIPGLHFPSHFLQFEWPEVAGERTRLVLPEGPHCRNADGTVNMAALGITADHVLAAPTRIGALGARLATIHMQVQFSGTPVAGDLYAESRLLGRSEGARLQRSLSTATISAGGKVVCHANGEFSLLAPPPGVVLGPLPWERTEAPKVVPVGEEEFESHERAVLKACDAALAKASPQVSFIQHFWGGVPRRTAQGASNRVAVGPHIGNRVGHVQGGILFGIAAANACAAAPAAMMLANLSAWYISPGRGTSLKVRSRLVHTGRTIAVVRTEVKNDAGERILEAVSHHAARKGD